MHHGQEGGGVQQLDVRVHPTLNLRDNEGDLVDTGDREADREPLPQALAVALREGEPLPLAQREVEGEPEGVRLPLPVAAVLRLDKGEREAGAEREGVVEGVREVDAQLVAEGEPL